MSESTQKSGNSTIAVVSAIYMLILAVLNICGSLTLLGLGAFAGGMMGAVNTAIEAEGEELSAEAAEALAQAAGATGIVTILGVIGLVVAVAALVMAIGIFMKKPWSYMGTIVVNGVYIVLGIVGILTSGLNPMTLVLMIISAVIIYLFYSNAEVKQVLGQA